MKQFVFFYPIPEIIDFEIENKGWCENGGVDAFRQRYKTVLNKCIDVRYKQRGFRINYVVFDGSRVSDVIELYPSDRIIEADWILKLILQSNQTATIRILTLIIFLIN